MRRFFFLGVALLAAGCINFGEEFRLHGENLPSRDDGGVITPADAGQTDAGTVDAGAVDAGPGDAGAPDAGTVDAGFCSTLGCFGQVHVFTQSSGVNGAIFDRPEGTVLLGLAAGYTAWYATLTGDQLTDQGRFVVDSTPLGGVAAVMPGASGDYFTYGSEVVHVGPPDQVSTTCNGASTQGNAWLGSTVGPEGDAWFVREVTELCHWTLDAGFERVSIPNNFPDPQVTNWHGVVVSPLDGGPWLLNYYAGHLYETDGTIVDAGAFEFEGVRRAGDRLYGWNSLTTVGLLEFVPGRGWKRVVFVALKDVWAEVPGDVWALAEQDIEGVPSLWHSEDGGWKEYSGANLYPPLPSGASFTGISGKGSRLMLHGRVLGTNADDGLALQLTRP